MDLVLPHLKQRRLALRMVWQVQHLQLILQSAAFLSVSFITSALRLTRHLLRTCMVFLLCHPPTRHQLFPRFCRLKRRLFSTPHFSMPIKQSRKGGEREKKEKKPDCVSCQSDYHINPSNPGTGHECTRIRTKHLNSPSDPCKFSCLFLKITLASHYHNVMQIAASFVSGRVEQIWDSSLGT